MDLYNADTGDMICTVKPYLGQGNLSVPLDEKDYIRIDPCIWGEDTGLLEVLHSFPGILISPQLKNVIIPMDTMAKWPGSVEVPLPNTKVR